MVDVSVIIVNYNTKELVGQCIKSVFDDKSVVNKEIIVVDNCSADGSIIFLRSLKENITNFQIIENSQNLGYAKAINQGISISKGKYKLLLNSDALLKKGVIDSLNNFAKTREDAAIVAPKLLNIDGSEQGSVFRFPTLIRAISHYWFFNPLLDKYSPRSRDPVKVEAVVFACVLITPIAVNKVGYLNEKYFMYFEDLDYCRRIKDAELSIYYLPYVEVFHHHGASGKSAGLFEDDWKRLIPSSKIYHGILKHYLINFVIWSGQKLQKIFS